MGGRDGGMKLYCPECQMIRTCTAVNPTVLGYERGQHWGSSTCPDINWFRRARMCDFGHEFLTAEIDEEFINELIELRETVQRMRSIAVQCINQTDGVLASLPLLQDLLRSLAGSKKKE